MSEFLFVRAKLNQNFWCFSRSKMSIYHCGQCSCSSCAVHQRTGIYCIGECIGSVWYIIVIVYLNIYWTELALHCDDTLRSQTPWYKYQSICS